MKQIPRFPEDEPIATVSRMGVVSQKTQEPPGCSGAAATIVSTREVRSRRLPDRRVVGS